MDKPKVSVQDILDSIVNLDKSGILKLRIALSKDDRAADIIVRASPKWRRAARIADEVDKVLALEEQESATRINGALLGLITTLRATSREPYRKGPAANAKRAEQRRELMRQYQRAGISSPAKILAALKLDSPELAEVSLKTIKNQLASL